MRTAVVFMALVCLANGRPAVADETPERVDASELLRVPGLPQLIIRKRSHEITKLSVVRFHAHVVLHPPLALVQIDETFFYPLPRPAGMGIGPTPAADGIYAANLPSGASVCRFAEYAAPDLIIDAEMGDRSRTSRASRWTDFNRLNAPLIEHSQQNLFTIETPGPAGARTKRFLLDYTVPITEREHGSHTFQLPLWSDGASVREFLVTGVIRGPTSAKTIRCESHPDTKFAAADNGTIDFELRKTSFHPGAPFSVEFQQRETTDASVRAFVAPPPADRPKIGRRRAPGMGGGFFDVSPPTDERERSAPVAAKRGKVWPDSPTPAPCDFLATISPSAFAPTGVVPANPRRPVDMLILADTSSGVSDPARLRQSVGAIVAALQETDRFSLGCVDVDFRSLTTGWVAPGSRAASQALVRLEQEYFLGECDFENSLARALASLPAFEPARRCHVIYVGDAGPLSVRQISAGSVQQAVVPLLVKSHLSFCAALMHPDSVGAGFVEQLARATAGRVFRIGTNDLGDPLSEWLREGCPEAVRIVDVKGEGVAEDDLFVPESWPPGRNLHISGRRQTTGPMKLRITIEREGKPLTREWKLDLKHDPDEFFVGRLWAQRKLDQFCGLAVARAGDIRTEELTERIVSLSQEWTLLSPYTALLVCGDESDFAKYSIASEKRHLHWKVGEIRPLEPLPPAVVTEFEPLTATPENQLDDVHFERAFAAAKRALEVRDPRQALQWLGASAEWLPPARRDEFLAACNSAVNLLPRGDLLQRLGAHRGLFDRRRPIGFASAQADVARQMLYGLGMTRHYPDPRMAVLDRQVPPPAVAELPMEDVFGWISAVSGLNVLVDRATLIDDGVALDQPLTFTGIRSMPLSLLLKLALEPMQLACIFDKGVLKITTAAKASENLTARLYPVGDLTDSGVTFDFSQMVDRFAERAWLVHRQLEEKLNRPVTVDFHNVALEEVLTIVREKLDMSLYVDKAALTEEGIALDTPVTVEGQDLLARRVLEEICKPLNLAAFIEDEVVKVSTASKAYEKLTTRFYSAQALTGQPGSEISKFLKLCRPTIGTETADASTSGFAGFGAGGFTASSVAVARSAADGDFQRHGMHRSASAGLAESTADPTRELLEPDDRPKFEGSTVTPNSHSKGEIDSAFVMRQLVSSMIEPESWEQLAGPGSIMYVPGLHGFVVRHTQAVHRQIEEYFDRWRTQPSNVEDNSAFRWSSNLAIDSHAPRWELVGLKRLFTDLIQPDTWEELAGVGSISLFPRMHLLAINQTDAAHKEIDELLRHLRTATYLNRSGRSWRQFGTGNGEGLPAAAAEHDLIDGAPGPRQTELPASEPNELKYLAALNEPVVGQQIWRSTAAPGGRSPEVTVVRQAATRSEFEFDGRIARVEGDDAAVNHTTLGLVERGNRGEGVRRLVDGRLPWLPHRSRHELARLFHVQLTSEDAQYVRLKLSLPFEASSAQIVVTVNRRHGLPTEWESRIEGRIMLRLRFEDLSQAGGQPIWKRIIAQDAAGQEVERWEMESWTALSAPIPAVDSGWENMIVLDQRPRTAVSEFESALRDGGVNTDDVVFDVKGQSRNIFQPIVRTLSSVQQHEWDTVDRDLARALSNQPGQPFLLIVKAWSLALRDGDHTAHISAVLEQVAKSGHAELLEVMSDRAFAQLGESAIYEILLQLPADRRRLVDLDRLALYARQNGKIGEAVSHLQQAVRTAGPSEGDPERRRLLVELLLESNRLDEAVALVDQRVAGPHVGLDEFDALIKTLHKGGARAAATRLIEDALARRQLTAESRHWLLLRRADVESGMERCRTILAVLNETEGDSPQWIEVARRLFVEFRNPAQAEMAAALSAQAHDDRLRLALKVRHAELMAAGSNASLAADAGWKLYEGKQLPAGRFDWLAGLLVAARQDSRLIRLVEDRLRAGATLTDTQLDTLAAAYEAVGRPDAVRRARTSMR
jgi:hypothetical protein